MSWSLSISSYDKSGYDRYGYDCYGYNRSGFDKYGYDRKGYDCYGYNRSGYDCDGYNKYGFNCYGQSVNGSISGRFFVDANCDNTEKAAGGGWEAGVSSATVKLYNTAGQVVATTTTDASGAYKFGNVAPGTYTVKFFSPTGYEFVQKDVGDNGADSDANASGQTDAICVGKGQTICNIDAGIKPNTGAISGTVFCDVGCDGINGTVTTTPGCDYLIQAESMSDCGFSTAWSSTASGGKIVAIPCAGGSGSLWTCFTGKTGTYDLTLRVQDESDGASTIKIKVNGVVVKTLVLNANDDGSGSNDGPFSDLKVDDLPLKYGDKIEIWAKADGGEYVRIDYLKLSGEGKTVYTPEPTKAGVVINLLDMNGKLIATTTTDANGNYRFDKIPAGDYRIQGVAPDGTHFTIQDAGSNDAIDSDVDGSGLSGKITVVPKGEADVDLGLCKDKLGSLSGKYFIDENHNDIDDGGAEQGVAGVTVVLLDAAGNPVPGVPNATTDANGNYAFNDLPAGTYGVKFIYTGTMTLVDPNVGADDALDSDAIDQGGGVSVISAIPVVAGQNTPDNDAGVEANRAPIAVDDEAKTCADETVTVNLLDGDSDPDGDTISVVSISDDDETAGVGGTITLASGATVTLNADGTATYDGIDAWKDLLVGEQAVDGFSYTVSDGDLWDTGDVTVDLCGAGNNLETIASGLPDEILFRINTLAETPVSGEGFIVTTSGTGNPVFDGVTFPEAYCLDSGDDLVRGVNIEAKLYVATESLAAGSSLSPTALANLDLINWILNQEFRTQDNGDGTNKTYTDTEIQGAIWKFTNNSVFVPAGTGTAANANEIVALALANGEGFEAGEGDIVGLLLDPILPSPTGSEQPFLIGIAFNDLALDCLCG